VESQDLSSLLAATVAFAIGGSVVLRDRTRRQNVRFAMFCFNLGLFHLSRFLFGFANVDIFERLSHTIALFLPWTADRLLVSFVPTSGRRRWQPGSGLRVTLGFGLFVAQTISLIFPEITEFAWWDVVPVSLGVYVVGGLGWASMRLWWAARAAEKPALAPRLRYLFYASLIALGLGIFPVEGIGPIFPAV